METIDDLLEELRKVPFEEVEKLPLDKKREYEQCEKKLFQTVETRFNTDFLSEVKTNLSPTHYLDNDCLGMEYDERERMFKFSLKVEQNLSFCAGRINPDNDEVYKLICNLHIHYKNVLKHNKHTWLTSLDLNINDEVYEKFWFV